MTITRTTLLFFLCLFCAAPAAMAQSDRDDAAFEALYTVFPKHVFPQRGRVQIMKTEPSDVILQKLESLGEKILGTAAEPLALFYRGNLLFKLDRFQDALDNNLQLKRRFPKHGLCRSLIPGKPSLVDQAIQDIQSELEVRKHYKVVKLPHATLDFSGKAVFHTAQGSFEIHCYTDAAPQTVANFRKLVSEGYYVGMSFHRILSFRRMTLGCPNTKKKDGSRERWGLGGPGYDLPMEFNDALHIGAAVSMVATSNGMSHGSQFTICLHNQPELNNKQAVFGKLTKGLEVLRKLSQTRIEGNGRPIQRIDITGTQWVKR